MNQVQGRLLASVASLVVVGFAATTACADQLLTGSIASAAGQKLEGVLVSAKKDGSTITTSVYTDLNGDYFFPAMADGKYQVWAQTLGFQTAKGAVDLSATRHQDFKLAAIADPEERIRQLPPEMLAAALPEETEADANIKRIFHNQCTGCHTPGYLLQFKFDEAGWNKVINLMKFIPNYPGPNAKANAIIQFNQKELAAYLARARGPGESSMKFKDRPRPTGEAARVVWTTYDLPLNPDVGIGTQVKYNPNDGSDWNLGTTSRIGQLPHDGGMGLDGNLYYTVNAPNKVVTIGKVDGKTGEVKYLKVDKRDGSSAATAHGITRDANGDFWFDINPGRRSLGKLETKTEKISVYETPPPMSPLGGAVTLDVDGKGKVWASAPDGAVRFDPDIMADRVYIETTFVSYLTARPSRDVVIAGHQQSTREWWEQSRTDFELCTSQLVLQEAGSGDPDAARERLGLLRAMVLLDTTAAAVQLAEALLRANALPEKAGDDALHIAIAANQKIPYLLTWNCRHLANATMRPVIEAVCAGQAYKVPIICTPDELRKVIG
jgi:hypothetical protein